MIYYFARTSEWDDPALDDDTETTLADAGSRGQRLEAVQEHYRALPDRIEHAPTPETLTLLARLLLPHSIANRIADRIEEILEPADLEANDPDGAREPKLSTASIRSFLKFCLRAGDFVDERFLPGRTYEGELGLQLLDPRLGDLSVRFLGNGRALVAIVAGSRQGSCQCVADDLLAGNDPFVVSRWLDPPDG